MSTSVSNRYSPGEELANALTHGIGAGLSIAALVVLVTFAGMDGDAWRVVSFSIYGACLVLLYTFSTFYHAFRSPVLKRIFRLFDHLAIYLLIAGTYTPITLVSMPGPWGWTLFGLIWGLAILGVVLELVFPDRLRWLKISIYLGMGWLMVIAVKPLVEAFETGALAWIVAGGLAYTGGVGFYLWKKMPYNHAVWHLFVLAGSACHFFCFLLYVLPKK